VLTDACALFTGGVPRDAEEIRARVETAASGDRPPFADLDERLYGVAEETQSLLGEFAIAHAADFRSLAPDEPAADSDTADAGA